MVKIEFSVDSEMPFERKVNISLVPNKDIHQYKNIYPVIWTGFIGNEKVELVQKTDASISIDDFEIISSPEKYKYLLTQIVRKIDDISNF